MIRVFYDANAIFIDTVRLPIAAGTLVASASGSTVVIQSLHSMQPIVSGDFTDIADANGSAFSSLADCLAYLNGQFAKRRPLGASYSPSQAIDTWTIVHGLGFYPNVTVVDTAGDQVVLSDVSYIDLNTALVRFGAPMTGTAYLS